MRAIHVGKGFLLSDEEIEKRPDDDESSRTAFTTVAVGVGLIIAAILVILTAGTPAAGIGFVIGAAACLGYGIPRLPKRERGNPRSIAPDPEKELLSAIRSSGGSITPAEAAMETSLTVREADEMLTGLANEGHLKVESRDGVLSYTLPYRGRPELG